MRPRHLLPISKFTLPPSFSADNMLRCISITGGMIALSGTKQYAKMLEGSDWLITDNVVADSNVEAIIQYDDNADILLYLSRNGQR